MQGTHPDVNQEWLIAAERAFLDCGWPWADLVGGWADFLQESGNEPP